MSKRISVLATLLLFIGGISVQAADKMFTAARSSRSSAVRRHGRSRRARSSREDSPTSASWTFFHRHGQRTLLSPSSKHCPQ